MISLKPVASVNGVSNGVVLQLLFATCHFALRTSLPCRLVHGH